MEGHGQRLHVALVILLVGLQSTASWPYDSRSSPTVRSPPCDEGYYQRDPIVLTCQGGSEKSMLQLTEAGTAQSFFYWRAPEGTKDLQATFSLSPVHDGTLGLAAVEIVGKLRKADEDESGTLLNHESLKGSEWSWSGNPENATAKLFKVWFRVKGALDRDIEVHLKNKFHSRLHGYIEYSWAGISPCPQLRLGCVRCPEDYCGTGKTAFCSGGSFIECVHYASKVSSPASQLRTTTEPPSPPKMVEGLFDIMAAVGGGIDVTRQSFKDMVEASLAAALHVPLSAIVRFRLVDVTSVVAKQTSQGRLLQSQRDVILAVAYRVLLPGERVEKLTLQLQEMGDGKNDDLLAIFTEILESHGVSVNGFKTVYPPTAVTKEELDGEATFTSTTPVTAPVAVSTSTAPVASTQAKGGLSPMVSGIQPPRLPEDSGSPMLTTEPPDTYAEPSWSSVQKVFVFSFAALLCAMGICFLCSVLQALNARRSLASHLDHSSERRRGDRQLDRVSSEDRLLLEAESPSNAGYPRGYEPVDGQLIGDEGM